MEAKERDIQIEEYLNLHKKASITALSELCKVSEMTIRRDLERLEKANKVIRIQKGARIISSDSYLPTIEERLSVSKEEKLSIAEYAASRVKPGEVIAMDDSSTTFAMIPFLPQDLTVVTNYLNVASTLQQHEKTEVILLGGKLKKETCSTVGKDLERMMGGYHVDKAFFSVKALSPEKELFDAAEEVAGTKRAFIGSGTEVIFLCDHTKLGNYAFSKVCDLKDISMIIMDKCEKIQMEQDELLQYCEREGIKIVFIA